MLLPRISWTTQGALHLAPACNSCSPPEGVEEAGAAAAACPGVTLCYQRLTVPGVWPYALYTMVHARSRDEAHAVLDRLRATPQFSGVSHRVLFSTRCFKQTGALLHRRETAA